VTGDEQEMEAVFEDRRWVFPRCDCLVLPVANTTSELLARYLGERLLDEIEARCGKRPGRLRLEIVEGSGHSATWRFDAG
jgi:6-pyruvoyltetrahydropterin/6-carboxytetrahydropterin synthase